MTALKKLCVFCGSSSGRDSMYVEEAKALGKYLASEQIQLTYGGGSIGLMGAIANAAHNDGQNKVLGIIPIGLCAREISGETVGEQIQTKDMHERKRLMAENSDGFVALPGGFGTMEELFEVITWQQLGYHKKPIGVLNVNGYFDSLLKFLDEARESGFVSEEARNIVLSDDDAERLIEKMRAYTAPRGVIEQEFQG
jgi:cytokinin riboside 5'-monophosphate phosphoribohydrolase